MTATAHTIYTWTIDQHPNPDSCIEWMRENWLDLYGWHEETMDSLKTFCEHFDVTLTDWQINPCSYSYVTIDAEHWQTECHDQDLTGVRLWKYLHNNGYLQIRNKWHPKHSERGPIVPLLDGHCHFTGYYMDETLLDAVREFIAHPTAGTTMQDIMNDAADRFAKAYLADWEYAYSDEGLRDMAEANKYEFTESGEVY